MKQIHKRLTYANVMSSLAVFLVLGGATAFAATKIGGNEIKANAISTGKIKKEAITTSKIKQNAVDSSRIANGAITGAKLNLAALGTVPSATNADQLGGVPAAGYARNQLEAVHVIGAPGQPAFENGCTNFGGGFQTGGFYKDPFGVVHLLGYLTGCAEGSSVFTLPAGFRPTAGHIWAVHKTDTTVGTVRVLPSGEVAVFSATNPDLDGLSFRTN